ncbi:MAG: PHP domain-containing protein, partial [Spirochaetes bacterium]|nr:PHP domain-containing protein [Spirochaetota bacterium]
NFFLGFCMYADLHIHTTASDGTWDIEEVLTKLKEKNITLFSITDHDTITNTLKMEEKLSGLSSSIDFIRGVEISATYCEKEYHILCYHFDKTDTSLLKLLAENIKRREQYNIDTIKKLEKRYSQIALSDFNAFMMDNTKGGWKSFQYCIEREICSNLQEYFIIMKELDLKLYFYSPQQVIQTIKEAGGIPVLAHPSAHFKREKMPDEELLKWLNMGIEGLECFTPYCDAEISQQYQKFCQKNNIHVTGGSDCHGTFVDRKLGQPLIRREQLTIETKMTGTK